MNSTTPERIDDLLGPPTDVSSVDINSSAALNCAAFELYKEASRLAGVVAHIYFGYGPDEWLSRNEAILAGLLIRTAKLMIAVLQLSDGKHDRGEAVLAINRSILESMINLRFLLNAKDDRFFDQFAEHSLGPERELYDLINANIKERGSTWPIEKRMLSSINRVCRLSGLTIDQVKPKYGDWGGGLKQRLKSINLEEEYLHLQRIPSHAVHGTWVDLVLHHLEANERGFRPRPKSSYVDARLLTPIATFVLEGVAEYLSTCFGSFDEIELIASRLFDLQQRIKAIDEYHEDLLTEK